MSLHPGIAASAMNAGAPYSDPVTILAGPTEGTSHVLPYVNINNTDTGARPMLLYLDDGVTHYKILRIAAMVSFNTYIFPFHLGMGPFVLPYGWDLVAETDVNHTSSEPNIVVSYANDTEGEWDLGMLESADRTWETLVPEPTAGRVRHVKYVTISNDDVVAHNYWLQLYDGSTGYWICTSAGIAADYAGPIGILISGGVIEVPHGWLLRAYCGIAENTNASHWTASYLETNVDDSGEG